ncbi:MAG: hypothetical protein ACRDPT_15615, partial [Streptomycetales bacterium]
MRRLPIRARLTAAFALAMVVVLAAAGLFIYLSLRADLDENINAGLRTRSQTITALARQPGTPLAGGSAEGLAEGEEGFAQLLTADGRVLDATGGAREPALSPSQTGRAAARPLLVERQVAGIA